MSVQSPQRWHRVIFALVLLFLVIVVVLIPFALSNVIDSLLHPQTSEIYQLIADSTPASTYSAMHLDVVSLDDWGRTVTIRVAGNHVCESPCNYTDRVIFVSSPESGELAEGLPPSEPVDFPAGGTRVSKTITLPVVGQPILFPFDRYRLGLGIQFERVLPDGTVQPIRRQEAGGHIYMSLQTHVPRTLMTRPRSQTPAQLDLEAPGAIYIESVAVTFARPLYLQILTVLVVLLVIIAAVYAVFLRPLQELVINAGALVLGVWGIRSILLGQAPPGGTVVDLVLSTVILLLLFAIATRAMWYHRRRAGIQIHRRRRR
jgi:hypothetical protein